MAKPAGIFDCEENSDTDLFSKNLLETMSLIWEEKNKVFGDNEKEAERIEHIYINMSYKASLKYQKSGGSLHDLTIKEWDIRLSHGISLKEIMLSELMFVSNVIHAFYRAGELKEAVNHLFAANRMLGEYCAYNALLTDFDEPTNKQPPKTFKRDTLLKLIYGMSSHSYGCTEDDIESTATSICNALKKHNILVDKKYIIIYLRESYKLKENWLENINTGLNATESEKNSMLKLIIGMAIDKYGHNVSSNRKYSTSGIHK